MPLILTQTDAAADCGADVGCSGGTLAATTTPREATEGGTPGTTEVSPKVAAGLTAVAVMFQSANNEPGKTSWNAGNWEVRLNVTTANTDVDWVATYVCRFDNACSSLETVGSLTGQTINMTAGTKAMTVSGAAQSAGATDEIYIVLEFVSNAGHGNSTWGITPSLNIDTPITVPINISPAAGVIAIAGKVPTVITTVGFSDSIMLTKNSYTPPIKIDGVLWGVLVALGQIAIFKSTDGGTVWDSVGSFGPTNTVESIWVEQRPGTRDIWIIHQESDGRVGVSVYSTETASFTTTNTIVASVADAWFVAAPTEESVSFKFYDNGTACVFYRYEAAASAQAIRAASITPAVVVTDRGDVDATGVKGGCVCIGSDTSNSNRMYAFYNGNGTELTVRTLSAAFSFGTAVVLDTSIDTATYIVGEGSINSSNNFVLLSYLNSDDKVNRVSFQIAATPGGVTIDLVISEFTVKGHGRTTAPFAVWTFQLNGIDSHCLYADDATQDIFKDKNIQATDDEIHNLATANAISGAVFNNKLGYFWDDAGTVKYNETIVNMAPVLLTNLAIARWPGGHQKSGPYEV